MSVVLIAFGAVFVSVTVEATFISGSYTGQAMGMHAPIEVSVTVDETSINKIDVVS